MLNFLGLPPVRARALFVRSYFLRLVEALDEAALADGKTVWLEKTPRHLHYLPAITRALPEAKFIHLVRSGPDVVASLYEVTHQHPQIWGGARSIDDCVNRWIKDVELSRQYQGHPNHLIVRYETLTENPEACLRTLFAFVGLPFSKFAQANYRHASERVVAPGEAWKKSVQREIKPLSNHKFDHLFLPEQQAYIIGRTRTHETPRS